MIHKHNMKNTTTVPTVSTTVTTVARKGNDTKKTLISGITAACEGYQGACEGLGKASSFLAVSRKGLRGAVELAASSGLFTAEELVKIVRDAAKSAGMSDSSASRALVAVGLRQRAERADKGSGRGRKPDDADTDDAPPTSAPEEEVSAKSIATAVVAALGREGALLALAKAYHLVKSGA